MFRLKSSPLKWMIQVIKILENDFSLKAEAATKGVL